MDKIEGLSAEEAAQGMIRIADTLIEITICLGHIEEIKNFSYGGKNIEQFQVDYDFNRNETRIKFKIQEENHERN
jgi:hypothetical protein